MLLKSWHPKVDVIVGLDARGFLLGPAMALAINKPFVPIRSSPYFPRDHHRCIIITAWLADFLAHSKSIACSGDICCTEKFKNLKTAKSY